VQDPGLNAAQREAVRYLDAPCLVIAGAGSGKTKVITEKMLYLMDAGHSPERITAITFTNKAAQEMAQRLSDRTARRRVQRQDKAHGPDGAASGVAVQQGSKFRRKPLICTFHALGLQLLRQEGAAIGLKPQFSILDQDDALRLIQEMTANPDRKQARSLAWQISQWKMLGWSPEAVAREGADPQVLALYQRYQAALGAYQAVDFDDLIRLASLVLDDPHRRSYWQSRIGYLLVDEYQDTNRSQYDLMRKLLAPGQAFTVVGDDDQSIYGWRGASLDNFRLLAGDYPSLSVIKLEQNYRSSQRILRAANGLIAANPKLYPKALWTDKSEGEPLQCIMHQDEFAEAESIVQRLIAHRFERKTLWGAYAMLYRSNHQARLFEQMLRKEGIPYRLSGGQSFFDRSEIRDLMAWLRLLVNEDDDPAFIRAVSTPKRGIGEQSLSVLGHWASERRCSMFAAIFLPGLAERLGARPLALLQAFAQTIHRFAWRARKETAERLLPELLQVMDYQAHLQQLHEERAAQTRWQYVLDFQGWVSERDHEEAMPLAERIQSLSLLSQLERREDQEGSLALSTIHAAKGLEFDHVVIVGCEEGLLPHLGPEEEQDEVSSEAASQQDAGLRQVVEERRLMYVAVTRARKSLTLSWAQARKKQRQSLKQTPSRFIEEMGLNPLGDALAKTASKHQALDQVAQLRKLLLKDKASGPP
jgi:ATP-dependent DNA helicase Rep